MASAPMVVAPMANAPKAMAPALTAPADAVGMATSDEERGGMGEIVCGCRQPCAHFPGIVGNRSRFHEKSAVRRLS